MDTYDLSIYQGQTFTLSLTVRDVSGNALNLNGYGVSGYLKRQYGDTGKLADLNAAITSPDSGVISLNMTHQATANLPVNYAFYDVEVRSSGDDTVTKVLAGKASIYPEATY